VKIWKIDKNVNDFAGFFLKNEDEIKIIEQKIKSFIKTLDQYSNEELVYYYKCALSRNTLSKGMYTSLIKAHL
jgi:hypothetical protein